MHEVEQDGLRKRPSCGILVYGHHIILIQLGNLKFSVHRPLIPHKIALLRLVSLDQQRTDRIQYHRLAVHLVDAFQYPEHGIAVVLLLAGKIRHIQRQFLRHQTILGSKIQNLYFKSAQFFKKRGLFLIAHIGFQIKQDLMNAILELLFQHFDLFKRIFIPRIQIQDHAKEGPGILMPHIGLPNLVKHPVNMVSLASDLRGQI